MVSRNYRPGAHTWLLRAASVQQSLAKEVVLWKHGVLVLPPIIHDTVRCMQARMQALLLFWKLAIPCMLDAQVLEIVGAGLASEATQY